VLGVLPGASFTEIRAAYLSLARRFHPDMAGGSAERMRELNQAWSVLGDDRQRRAYDLRIGAARIGDDGPDSPVDAEETAEADLADLLDDRPLRLPSTRHGVIVVTPVALFFGSIAIGIFGMLMMSPVLLGAAVGSFALAALLMVALPLLEMTRSRSIR